MSINNISLTGRICKELELKTTQSDKSVCSFNIAVDDGWGENKKTLFITIVAWSSTAEYISKYANKGDLVAVNGRLAQREYTSKDGVAVKVFEVVANAIQLMSKSGAGEHDIPVKNNFVASSVSQNEFKEITAFDDDLPF